MNKAKINAKPIPKRKLGLILDEFLAQTDLVSLIHNDPVEIVHEFRDPHDQEVVGLVVALLAYGRVASIKSKSRALIEPWGRQPAAALDSGFAAKTAQGFIYRFQKGNDLPELLKAMARLRSEYGSLAAAFASGLCASDWDYGSAMDRFSEKLRNYLPEELSYGLRFLLPGGGETRGAAKRLCLYLRWMIRDDHREGSTGGADLGVWQQLVPGEFSPAKLIIPLDTHIARVALNIGLTDKKSINLAMAREITSALRKLRPEDPLYYDMALCHLGISGDCPGFRQLPACSGCPIRGACRLGRKPRGWTY